MNCVLEHMLLISEILMPRDEDDFPPEEPVHVKRFLCSPFGNGCREASLVILPSRTYRPLGSLFC